MELPRWHNGKESTCECRRHWDSGLIPGSARFPGAGNSNSLQYSCLENSKDREGWWATVHGVAELDMIDWLCTHIRSGNLLVMIRGLLATVMKELSQFQRWPWFWAPLLSPWCKASHLWPWDRPLHPWLLPDSAYKLEVPTIPSLDLIICSQNPGKQLTYYCWLITKDILKDANE